MVLRCVSAGFLWANLSWKFYAANGTVSSEQAAAIWGQPIAKPNHAIVSNEKNRLIDSFLWLWSSCQNFLCLFSFRFKIGFLCFSSSLFFFQRWFCLSSFFFTRIRLFYIECFKELWINIFFTRTAAARNEEGFTFSFDGGESSTKNFFLPLSHSSLSLSLSLSHSSLSLSLSLSHSHSLSLTLSKSSLFQKPKRFSA